MVSISYWSSKWKKATTLCSLHYMSLSNCGPGKPTLLRTSIKDDPMDVKRATIKARILTGTYTLQANKAKVNQNTVDPTCRACQREPEDRSHFLLRCSALSDIRQPYLLRLYSILPEHLTTDITDLFCNSEDMLMQLLHQGS
jgi:hypothetical protein